jgi:hypothetical protein
MPHRYATYVPIEKSADIADGIDISVEFDFDYTAVVVASLTTTTLVINDNSTNALYR